MKLSKVQTILYLTFFVLSVFMSSFSIVILQLVRNYGFDEETAGQIGAFKSFFLLIPSFGASYILKFSYKNSMLFGLMGLTLASIIIATTQNFWAILFFFALGGFSFTIIKLSVYSTVGLIATNHQKHAELMNRVEGAYVMGALLSPLLFSWMMKWYSWSNAYWIITLSTVAVFGLLLKTELDNTETNKELEKPNFSQMLALLNHPLVWIALICAVLYGMLELGFKTWLPTFNTEVFKLSEDQSTLFLSIYAGAIALSRFLLSYLHQRFSWLYLQMVYLLGALLSTLTVLTLTSADKLNVQENWYVILLASIFSFVGFFFGPIYPTICSIVLSHLPKTRHSAMSGLIVLFTELGIASGIFVIGFFSKHFNIHYAFYTMLIPMCLLLILLIIYDKILQSEKLG